MALPQSNSFAGDMSQNAGSAAVGNGIQAGVSGIGAIDSANDCMKKAVPGAPPPPSPWMSCAKLGLNLLSLASALGSMANNKGVENATSSDLPTDSGIPGTSSTGGSTTSTTGYTDTPIQKDNPFTNGTPLPSGVTINTVAACKADVTSVACTTNLQDDVNRKLSEYKSALASGAIAPPPGSTASQAIASLNKHLGSSSGGLDALGSPASGGTNVAAAEKSGSEPAAALGGGGGGGDSGGLSLNDPFGANAAQKTPNPLAPFDAYSEATEAGTNQPELTIWEKITKLYMGPQAAQGLSLASVERDRKSSLADNNRLTLPSTAQPNGGRATAATTTILH